MSEVLQDARETWDNIDIDKVRNVGWLAISFFGRQMEIRLTENYQITLAYLLHQRYTPEELKQLKGLALVCGDMASERAYFEELPHIAFETVDGYDLSPESIKRFSTDKFKFIPHVMDVNDLVLAPEQFDLIACNHGIHHVYNLGGCFYQAHKSIKPKGMFVLNEWIGPPYLQIPLRNHIVASLLLFLLFPFRNTRLTHDGRVKGLWLQYGPKAFDPSEACNAAELMPQLLKYFKVVRIVRYGGLGYPMFEGWGHKIDERLFINQVRIRIVYYLELILTKLRLIRPLFISAIVEKRADINRQSNWMYSTASWLKSKYKSSKP